MEKMVDQLELFAEELPEQTELAAPLASLFSASSLSTASCPGSSVASVGSVSTFG